VRSEIAEGLAARGFQRVGELVGLSFGEDQRAQNPLPSEAPLGPSAS
jgi:hypothetical protein